MAKEKKMSVQQFVLETLHQLRENAPDIVAESFLLDGTQAGAVMSGLNNALNSLTKLLDGLEGEYVPKKRAPKPRRQWVELLDKPAIADKKRDPKPTDD